MEHDILNEIITNTVGNLFLGSGCFFDTGHSGHHQGRSNMTSANSSSGSLHLLTLEKKTSLDQDDFGKDSRSFLKMIDPNTNNHQIRSGENSNMKFKAPDTGVFKKSDSANTSVGSIQLSVSSVNKSREETHSRSSSTGNQLQVVNQNIPPNSENYNVESWVRRDGPQKLYESLKRLNLDLNAINRINLSNLTADEITVEKKRVKNELKRYDTAFSAVFKRIPSREEKEPMRPLYIYYKKLKQTIGRTGPAAKSTTITPTTTSNSPAITSQKSSTSGVAQMVLPEKNNRILGNGNFLQEEEKKNNSQGEKKLDSSFEYNLSKDATKELNFEPKLNNYFNPPARTRNTNSRTSVSQGFNYDQARRELEDLKKSRAELRDRLHSYQVDFTRSNNRKIKYHRDILPVENEYKRYKEIKQEIQRLEGLLGVA